MTHNPENLPVPQNEFLTSLAIVIPEPIFVDHDATHEETKKADIQMFNASLKVLYALWGEVKTFSSALAMIDKTMNLIEKRRAILGHPYGITANKGSSAFTVEPLP